jgi:hypothetical protein
MHAILPIVTVAVSVAAQAPPLPSDTYEIALARTAPALNTVPAQRTRSCRRKARVDVLIITRCA